MVYKFTNAGRKESIVYHKDLSYKIVGLMYEVYNEFGHGYQEKYYERAVAKIFTENNIKYIRQAPCKLVYKGEIIGKYYIDFVVENKMVVELKKGNYFPKKNIEQVVAYLKTTKLDLGLLVNFTSNNVKFRRILNPNNLK
jgi:GxxExxY protein